MSFAIGLIKERLKSPPQAQGKIYSCEFHLNGSLLIGESHAVGIPTPYTRDNQQVLCQLRLYTHICMHPIPLSITGAL